MGQALLILRRYFPLLGLAVAIAIALPAHILSKVAADDTLPRVELNADNLGPRPLEQLTGQVVPRDYAYAWQALAEALDKNQSSLLDGYFTGWARENFASLISQQARTGIHTRYVDHGHKLVAMFYAPAGDAMQLRDAVHLEIQVFDGNQLIDREEVTLKYMVLMTPGADRWLVRDLETVAEVEH
jgi:hypothetical protein